MGDNEECLKEYLEGVEAQQSAFFSVTLRDYFAAKAMQAGLACLQEPSTAASICEQARGLGIKVEQMFAADSYKVADAMLAERAK